MRTSVLGSWTIGIFIALSVTAGVSATSKDCNKDILTDADKDLLFQLHNYALIQEWAFHRADRTPSPSCRTQSDEYELTTPDYSSMNVLSLRELEQNRWISLTNIIEDKMSELRYTAVYSAEFSDGQERYYLSCHREDVIPQLAVNLRMVGPIRSTVVVIREDLDSRDMDSEDMGSSEEVSINVYDYKIFLDVAIAIPSSLLEMANNLAQELSMEQIETVVLNTPVANPVFHHGHDEKMYLIRGTNFNLARLFDGLRKELAASAKHMAGRACVFPAVAKVVANITKKFEHRSVPIVFIVVGHSLGGTAAQYIASDRESHPDDYRGRFSAYAFNGIGLQSDENIKDLTSYIVVGDWLGMLPGSQVGTVVRYSPMSLGWRVWPSGRHGIEGVQRSLCRCWETEKGILSSLSLSSVALISRPSP